MNIYIKDIRGCFTDQDSLNVLMVTGIKVIKVWSGGEYILVELPPGWKSVLIYDMDSDNRQEVLDDHGRCRIAVRRQQDHVIFFTRFNAIIRFDEAIIVRDTEVMFRINRSKCPATEDDRVEWARAQAISWLDEHYPDWRNPAAYWD